jgi:hypothetical protein
MLICSANVPEEIHDPFMAWTRELHEQLGPYIPFAGIAATGLGKSDREDLAEVVEQFLGGRGYNVD